MENFNVCMSSDSYKCTHYQMMPKGTEKVYSYFESREGATYDQTVFFGLQYLLKEFLVGKVVTEEVIRKAKRRIDAHLYEGAFNETGWRHILNKYDGKLPVRISAVQEGEPVGVGNVLMTVENTDPGAYWLTNYLETLLTHVWAPSTVATTSFNVKKMIKGFLDRTSDTLDSLDFALHDFGARGVSSIMSGGISGAGHLVNFMGTDTLAALDVVMDYYNVDEVPAFSVNASEHSVMTAEGREGEMNVFGRLLDKFSAGILSIVIDSYDYRAFVKNACSLYKDKILARDGKVVFRPDSGNPNEVTVEVYELLKEGFGTTTNSKGFEVLNPKIGILWGDGIDAAGVRSVLYTLELRGISAENIVFGMGGGLLQKINRDTQRFAFKSSYQERNGVGYDIFKQPIDGTKTSKKGKFKLLQKEDGAYCTVSDKEPGENKLELVYENGELIRDMNFNQVRANANKYI